MTALAIPQRAPLDPVARIASFMMDFSIEATRPSDADIAALSALPRGTQIYVSAVPNRPAEESVSAAARLRAAGFEPVPHVAARNFPSAAALDDFLARLHGEADVRRALVIAGDRAEYGPFKRAHDAIDSAVFGRRGSASLGSQAIPTAIRRSGPTSCSGRWQKKSPPPRPPGLPWRSSRSSVSTQSACSIT
jgi:methylenetetrahydrofolate reductase (NADPH)